MSGAPPLLVLAAGGRPRLRRPPSIAPKEHVLHIATAKILKDHCLTDWRWFHPASGEHRDIRTAAKLKAMGVRRGIPDFCLVSPAGFFHCLELKRLGEDLTKEQEDFRDWAEAHGIPHAVAWTIDQVLAAFDAWGCLRIRRI